MKAEQQELYNFVKNQCSEELSRIKPESCSPIIAIRVVVKHAIDKYLKQYCSLDIKPEDVFSSEDFQAVSNRLYTDITGNDSCVLVTYNSKVNFYGNRLNLLVNETKKELYFHTCHVFDKGNVHNDLGIREVQHIYKGLLSDGYKEVKFEVAKLWRQEEL